MYKICIPVEASRVSGENKPRLIRTYLGLAAALELGNLSEKVKQLIN